MFIPRISRHTVNLCRWALSPSAQFFTVAESRVILPGLGSLRSFSAVVNPSEFSEDDDSLDPVKESIRERFKTTYELIYGQASKEMEAGVGLHTAQSIFSSLSNSSIPFDGLEVLMRRGERQMCQTRLPV